MKEYITNIPNWPKENIQFKDITTLLENSKAFQETINILTSHYKEKNIQKIIAIDARGFIFASPLAYNLNLPLVLVRKKGKLPPKTIQETYELEYAKATIEIKENSIKPNDNVIIIDDLIATGGTTLATIYLLKKLKANILSCGFLIELEDLPGSKIIKNKDIEVFSLIKYKD